MKGNPLEWVYFKRLARDAYKPKKRPELAALMAEGGAAVAGAHINVSQSASNGSRIITMAQAELAKEQAFLQQVFGVALKIDFRQPGAIKMLIETINACLNLKEIYERNRDLIKAINADGSAQKGVFSYFPEYILQAFREFQENIKNDIIKAVKNGSNSNDATKKFLNLYFDTKIIPLAIEKMFTVADVEKSGMDKYKNAYKDFYRGLSMLPNNPYTAQLKSAWHIDELINELTEAIVNSKGTRGMSQKLSQKRGGELAKLIRKHQVAYGEGVSLENMNENIQAMVSAGLTGTIIGNKNFKIKIQPQNNSAIQNLGQLNARPDGGVTYGVSTTSIETILGNSQFANRKEAVNAFNRVGKYLEKLKKGSIVYTNAKNYSLNDNFRSRGGFSAGESMSLETLESALSNVVNNVQELEAIILNAGKGAINDGNLGDASLEISKAIAYALFDDWDYIGQLPKGGGFALHVFNLNGILIPLSTFLYGFGRAIEQATMNPTSFVKAQIHTATYDTSDAGSYGMYFWTRNPIRGKNGTTISFNFLKDFTSLIAQYL